MWADSLSCTTELEVFAGWCFEAVNCLPLPPSPCNLVLFAIYPSQLLHLTVIWLPKEHGPKWLGTDSVLSQAAPTLCQVNYMKNISLVRWGLFISPSHLCWHQSGGCQQELVRLLQSAVLIPFQISWQNVDVTTKLLPVSSQTKACWSST